MKLVGKARLFAIHNQFLVFDSARLVDVEMGLRYYELAREAGETIRDPADRGILEKNLRRRISGGHKFGC